MINRDYSIKKQKKGVVVNTCRYSSGHLHATPNSVCTGYTQAQ